MPLSDHEQRMLDQIESALYAEDPKFASSVRGGTLRAPSTRRRLQGAALFLSGLAMLVSGVAFKATMIGTFPILSVIGFIVMFGGVVFAITGPRVSGNRETPASSAAARQKRFPRQPAKGCPVEIGNPVGNCFCFVGQMIQSAHCAASLSSSSTGMMGNSTPLLRTANIVLPSIQASSPCSTSSYMTERASRASRRPRTLR